MLYIDSAASPAMAQRSPLMANVTIPLPAMPPKPSWFIETGCITFLNSAPRYGVLAFKSEPMRKAEYNSVPSRQKTRTVPLNMATCPHHSSRRFCRTGQRPYPSEWKRSRKHRHQRRRCSSAFLQVWIQPVSFTTRLVCGWLPLWSWSRGRDWYRKDTCPGRSGSRA